MEKFVTLNKLTTLLNQNKKRFLRLKRSQQSDYEIQIGRNKVILYVSELHSDHIVGFDQNKNKREIPFHLLTDWNLSFLYIKFKKHFYKEEK